MSTRTTFATATALLLSLAACSTAGERSNKPSVSATNPRLPGIYEAQPMHDLQADWIDWHHYSIPTLNFVDSGVMFTIRNTSSVTYHGGTRQWNVWGYAPGYGYFQVDYGTIPKLTPYQSKTFELPLPPEHVPGTFYVLTLNGVDSNSNNDWVTSY